MVYALYVFVFFLDFTLKRKLERKECLRTPCGDMFDLQRLSK